MRARRGLLGMLAKGRRRIRVLTNPLLSWQDLARNDLSEHANHPALLSLPCWEIEVFLHDTVQTEPPRPRPVERAVPGTDAQSGQGAAQEGREGLSSARTRRGGGHSDSAGQPRVPVGARRRGRRVPFARRRNSPRPGSWHALPEMQQTVQFVLGLKGAMSEAELFVMRARL